MFYKVNCNVLQVYNLYLALEMVSTIEKSLDFAFLYTLPMSFFLKGCCVR